MKSVDVLGVSRSNLAERLKGGLKPRSLYPHGQRMPIFCRHPQAGERTADLRLSADGSLLNRESRRSGCRQRQRAHLTMDHHGMLLEKHTAVCGDSPLTVCLGANHLILGPEPYLKGSSLIIDLDGYPGVGKLTIGQELISRIFGRLLDVSTTSPLP